MGTIMATGKKSIMNELTPGPIATTTLPTTITIAIVTTCTLATQQELLPPFPQL